MGKFCFSYCSLVTLTLGWTSWPTKSCDSGALNSPRSVSTGIIISNIWCLKVQSRSVFHIYQCMCISYNICDSMWSCVSYILDIHCPIYLNSRVVNTKSRLTRATFDRFPRQIKTLSYAQYAHVTQAGTFGKSTNAYYMCVYVCGIFCIYWLFWTYGETNPKINTVYLI